MNNRDYFINSKLADGYDIHEAHELWFRQQEERRVARRKSKAEYRDIEKSTADHVRSRKKYPSHYSPSGGRTVRGVGS